MFTAFMLIGTIDTVSLAVASQVIVDAGAVQTDVIVVETIAPAKVNVDHSYNCVTMRKLNYIRYFTNN